MQLYLFMISALLSRVVMVERLCRFKELFSSGVIRGYYVTIAKIENAFLSEMIPPTTIKPDSSMRCEEDQ